MAVKLFESANRDEAHAKLEEILASGQYPAAECRDNFDAPGMTSVWSDRDDVAKSSPQTPPPQPPQSLIDLDALAALIVTKLKGG